MKDPICGMEMNKGEEHSQVVYQGRQYFFCSEACESVFKKLHGLGEEHSETTSGIERRMAAYNTLKQLAITVAHYISNANVAIGLQAQILSQAEAGDDMSKSISMISEQSKNIESVVSALLAISDIKLQKYAGEEEGAMLDLRLALEDKIKELEKK